MFTPTFYSKPLVTVDIVFFPPLGPVLPHPPFILPRASNIFFRTTRTYNSVLSWYPFSLLPRVVPTFSDTFHVVFFVAFLSPHL